MSREAMASPQKVYTFSSRPRPLQNRSKYRDPAVDQNEARVNYGNVMYDRRVVRGNTYAQHALPLTDQLDTTDLQRVREARRKRVKDAFLRTRSPDPVEGRRHATIQTELYLEELSNWIDEASVECQTNAFTDTPATPLFVPAKSGKDAATQIEEGELFDFDMEVRPLVEVLVGKTVEQAQLEVMEEEELASLRAQQQAFHQLRNIELMEVQRLEEQQRRRREEKERCIREHRIVIAKEKETAEKVAARAFAQSYLSDLLPSVYSSLQENGFFYDPVERELETVLFPTLMSEVSNCLENHCVARTTLDMIIQDVIDLQLKAEVNTEGNKN
ncbi:radial spoke head protein 3 homolog isoform X2 [Denticeps clupeoides]|uniref:Radial spoke protein 3 n=1 Tax=Denticeps clupeoides TaxID=299321 RepID=A0AAY3ZX64_9TELE|nr:radial spoke head protein 3 homolog isoform X2 [Denticeps clupeoides]